MFLAELSRARSGSSAAPWARKFGYQCIQEILVLKNRPYVCTYIHPIHVSRGEILCFKHPRVSGVVNRMATRTFREKKYNNNKADSFFRLNFNVYNNVDKRERARRSNKKQRRPSSLEEKRENFIAMVRK